jgi:hypothetical protein
VEKIAKKVKTPLKEMIKEDYSKNNSCLKNPHSVRSNSNVSGRKENREA